MKRYIGYMLLSCLALVQIACQEDPAPGGTVAEKAAGEWWVKFYMDDGTGNLELLDAGYYKAMTFNTAANNDSIWVTDMGNFWDFQVKARFNKSNNTFEVSEGTNVSYESEVTITDGKVLLGQGRSSSGVKTDSIYFVTSFSDDDPAYGAEYIIAGHRRTGFLEDEH
jgi:hypothetical protein